MPEKRVIQRARKKARQGKAPSTQAGEFVRDEIEHVRKGVHGAANVKQAIAIGLSRARRAGVRIPRKGQSAQKRAQATGVGLSRESARKRGRVSRNVLKRKPRSSAATRALSQQARQAARRRRRT